MQPNTAGTRKPANVKTEVVENRAEEPRRAAIKEERLAYTIASLDSFTAARRARIAARAAGAKLQQTLHLAA
ncbi:hypothetical protein [Arthrobacter sp. A2-55]|uniref:hypothetical protein n=1 Tax=Arthrobacter sp. A2-55 TaxID=2897337 RepID=UPI0021CD948C|nr:hypothetical protein [Arthrobacter sp. A2-55]MCU6480165.1 hypothetical protein [Arthrobacter sp. A2-55]